MEGHQAKARVLMVGLDGSGKTSILYRHKLDDLITTIPTIGFNFEDLILPDGKIAQFWDLGGQKVIRSLWKHYFEDIQVLIFVVATDKPESYPEAREELDKLMSEPQLLNIPLLVFANKIDIHHDTEDFNKLVEQLGLTKLNNRAWFIQKCSALTGDGISEGLQWLTAQLPQQAILP